MPDIISLPQDPAKHRFRINWIDGDTTIMTLPPSSLTINGGKALVDIWAEQGFIMDKGNPRYFNSVEYWRESKWERRIG